VCSALALLLLFLVFLRGSSVSRAVDLDGSGGTGEGRGHEVFILTRGQGFLACLVEECLNAVACRSARLKVRVSTVGSAPGLSLLACHRALRVFVRLVAAHDEGEGFRVLGRRLIQEVLLPEIEAIEALLAAHVEGEDAGIGATIEGESNGGVFFLTGRIPHLHVDLLAINGHRLRFEVCADSGLRVHCSPICKLVDKRCLANANVAEEDDLGEEFLLMTTCFNH